MAARHFMSRERWLVTGTQVTPQAFFNLKRATELAATLSCSRQVNVTSPGEE